MPIKVISFFTSYKYNPLILAHIKLLWKSINVFHYCMCNFTIIILFNLEPQGREENLLQIIRYSA